MYNLSYLGGFNNQIVPILLHSCPLTYIDQHRENDELFGNMASW